MQVHDIVLTELLEHFDFAHRRFLHNLIVIRLFELFYCNFKVISSMLDCDEKYE